MNIKRRSLLKGMALGGLAGAAMAGAGLASAMNAANARPGLPILALVSAAVAESAFIHGLGASPAARRIEVQRVDLGLDFILGLQQRLRSGQPQRIIGLVDDASAALIVDLARSAGARVQWLGQHSASSNASHHRLLSAETASSCALQLGQRLNACGTGFSLDERRLQGQRPLHLAAAARSSGGTEQWAATLGYNLASLGSAASGQAPLIANRPAALAGTFVSFSIEA